MNELTSLLHAYSSTPVRGTKLGHCKLSLEEAQDVKNRHWRGESLRAIAKHYGCCHRTILNVIRGHCAYGRV